MWVCALTINFYRCHIKINNLQEIVRKIDPVIITPNHALRLRASQDLMDKGGNPRCTGEEWLVREVGAYLTGVFETVRALRPSPNPNPSPSPIH